MLYLKTKPKTDTNLIEMMRVNIHSWPSSVTRSTTILDQDWADLYSSIFFLYFFVKSSNKSIRSRHADLKMIKNKIPIKDGSNSVVRDLSSNQTRGWEKNKTGCKLWLLLYWRKQRRLQKSDNYIKKDCIFRLDFLLLNY